MKNVAIMMAVGGYEDKVPHLSNVLCSIKKQNGIEDHNIKLCFFLDGGNKYQKSNLVQAVNNFFDSDQVLYSESDKPVGFQFLPSFLAKMVPEETDVVIFQSSDIIWYDKNILTTMIEKVEEENSAFSCKIANFIIDVDLFEKTKTGDEFHQSLEKTLNNVSLRSPIDKPSKYLYLGAMRPDVFRGIGAQPFVCDVIQHHWLKDNNVPIRELENVAIHQNHRPIRYACSSLPVCPSKYWCYRKAN